MTLAGQLYRLQEVDLGLEATSASTLRVKLQLADNSAISAANSRLKQARAALDDLKHRQTEMEWQSADLASKIEKLREKLYGGRITNSKELTGLKQDFDFLQADRKGVDDNILVLMEQAEAAEGAVNADAKALKEVEASTQEEHRHLSAELERMNANLARLGQERQALSVAIDATTLALYGQLRKQKGRAVVPMERGSCRGCGITLTAAWLQRARAGELVRCSSCNRILYLE